ncbi:protein regulator of cytokinesis 1-like isoform X2 [Portunus trituberculatus]|uniref:protein regulator of cytokinesis 1-like isoform X2 n=1 Tax=Portunus trituberculatus TaxID=210409 RepID=UPI001E1CE86A|nr:protein regulator of cytokinesis 1-like isoform X2 [Portunus trituberculatus]
MKTTIEEINEVVHEAATKLNSIWSECGFSEEMCRHRRHKMVDHVKALMSQMIDGEKNLRKTLVKSIDDNGSKFYHLNKELGADIPDPEENLSLIELERYLRRAVAGMEKEVKERQNALEELRSQEKELCECLKEKLSDFEKKAIPSKESIKDLERIVKTLEQEKVDRVKTFHRLKDNLERLLKELEQSPVSSFECSVVAGLEELFVLSTDNLKRLKMLNEEYEKRVEDNKCESVELQEKIRLLSDRLGHDPGGRDQLLASMAGHAPSSLAKLQEQMALLEEAKKENMGNFISQLRHELEEMWEKCYVGEEEKEAFSPYVSDECTEEVLEAHNVEVERLKKFHGENQKVYAVLDQWHQLWGKHLDLEERSNNPDRLFGNRGCALLQEEKERRRVRGELPRLEKELEDLVEIYNEKSGQPFLVKGQTVSDYILDHWHRYYDQRKQEKKERQTARTKELLHETRLGSRPRTVSYKRHMAAEESGRKTKQRRIQENNSPEPSLVSTIVTTPHGLGGRSILRDRNQKTLRPAPTEKDKTHGSSQEISTYSNFSHSEFLNSFGWRFSSTKRRRLN